MVRFEAIVIDVSNASTIADVRETLLERARTLRPSSTDPVLVLSAELTGGGPVHEELMGAGAASELLGALRAAADQSDAGLWWSGLRDHTARQRDLSVVGSRGDLTAELLNTGKELRDQPRANRQIGQPLERADLSPAAFGLLLAEAETRALDLLERPEEA